MVKRTLIVAMEIDPRNNTDNKITTSPLGGDDKQGALYMVHVIR